MHKFATPPLFLNKKVVQTRLTFEPVLSESNKRGRKNSLYNEYVIYTDINTLCTETVHTVALPKGIIQGLRMKQQRFSFS